MDFVKRKCDFLFSILSDNIHADEASSRTDTES